MVIVTGISRPIEDIVPVIFDSLALLNSIPVVVSIASSPSCLPFRSAV
jgi:hypothetical protein